MTDVRTHNRNVRIGCSRQGVSISFYKGSVDPTPLIGETVALEDLADAIERPFGNCAVSNRLHGTRH